MAHSIRQRLADAALSRLLRQGPAANDYVLTTARTPMRDGVVLVGDHFAPVTARPRGTVLIRTPYGRGFPASALNGRLFAARGYHVIIQSVRGTFGSGGRFRPMAQEAEDGLDTVAWLREQPWFDGRLATLGASYLGWAQWALLQDPPPELRTAVVYVGPHDFREAVFGTGAFTVGDFLGWSDMIARQEDGGLLRRLLNGASAERRLRPALAGVPLPDAADPVLRGRAPWYREWLSHPDGDDPWWLPYRAGDALTSVSTPVLIISGWQDLFLEQSLQQYDTLSARGVDVGLTVGPWTHLQLGLQGAMTLARESLAWLDQHMASAPAARKSPVRVFRTGERRWHELASWPPPAAPAVFQLHADRTLTLAASPAPTPPESSGLASTPADPAPTPPDPSGLATTPAEPPQPASASRPSEGTVRFRYDPADPTPTVGGRTLTGSMGVKDNRKLEARSDVLTFTTDPLPTAVDVIGSPVLDLALAVDPAHADVFVRLCDVDRRGRSRNFADRMLRLDPAIPAGQVQNLSLMLDPCFHRLAAGHRLRLQISGGSFPRFARNLGTPGDPAEAHDLKPQEHTVHCADSRLTIPVAAT
ncbi:CocE/NonD family hydrolase [Actinoplanes sp. LDG1-06]|uniref:CocE/NonD family hydrolase n=1 Tax=Paractinoplanes ovalisporus TaxID=2810368 RepID=A0ABS2AN32_9ACTN|nr:CocE/NonD family hydrolase [Actinoplanes ovalisporus]MBM2621240.1 CocE/NonD family hydrolase [Actinoplanes ovalisporus]